jgi:hypothetical protein
MGVEESRTEVKRVPVSVVVVFGQRESKRGGGFLD